MKSENCYKFYNTYKASEILYTYAYWVQRMIDDFLKIFKITK